MKKEEEKKLLDADIQIYARAKMKKIHVNYISEVKIEQYSNCEHEKHRESLRINAPNDLEDGKTYNNSIVGMLRNISIKKEKKC